MALRLIVRRCMFIHPLKNFSGAKSLGIQLPSCRRDFHLSFGRYAAASEAEAKAESDAPKSHVHEDEASKTSEHIVDNKLVDRVLRVDLAGEEAADKIYAGQLAVLGKTDSADTIQHMWEQEKHHLATMKRLIVEHKGRPSLLMPVWSVAGYVLGAGTAMLGKEAAMACTAAVEEVIGEHYNDQIRELMADDPVRHKELLTIIKQFRDEELEHMNTGLENDAEKAPLYDALSTVIKAGCKGAIFVAERI